MGNHRQPGLHCRAESVQFLEREAGACAVSTDSTYGYTQENPIRTGGDWMDGPARERMYLDNLLGPNGESITYERLQSLESGDTILDLYEVKTGGNTYLLYLDEYSFSEPLAPVGLTCAGDFGLAAP